MDMNLILQAISTVGFPIFACGALFWLVNKLESEHKQEVNSLREIIDRNTEALIELKDIVRRE
jgi:hypothetical protein